MVKKRYDLPWIEKEINPSFKQLIMEFPYKSLPIIYKLIEKYKDGREQFEMRTHKRLIDIKNPSKEVIDALTHLDVPSGVDVKIETK